MSAPAGLAEAVTELTALLGERCSTKTAIRDHHSRDESYLPPALPDAVVFPETVEEVQAIVRICAGQAVPLIPFGAGTSLEGHVLATTGGVCVDMTRFKKIVELRRDDLDVTVEAGVTRMELNDRLRRDGLFFPVDPGADATLGGMAATGASGTSTVKYGTMSANVLALDVVLPDGSLIHTGTRARKSSAGYDLTSLLVGSEGTMGIITGLTLRVYGIPETVSAAVVQFESLTDAVQTVIETLQLGIPVSRIELLDGHAMRAINAYANFTYAEAPTLFLEFEGTPVATADAVDSFGEVVREHSPMSTETGLGREFRDRLWSARHNAYYASLAMRPGSRSITTDVCVPISRLADNILDTERDLDQASFPSTLVGHVGDGNYHILMLVDPDQPDELAEAKEVNARLVRRAIVAGGTCTGKHGIGVGKRGYLREEAGSAVDLMQAIKRTIDPLNIMNPGKVI